MPKFVALVLSSLLVCACTTYKKELPAVAARKQQTPEVYKLSDRARQARLAAVVLDLPVGYRYGEAASGTAGSCYFKVPLVNTKGRLELETKSYLDVFNDVMKAHGYSVEEQVEVFKGSEERVADLQLGARIVEATLNECYPDINRNDLKAVGSAYLKIEWSVFSALEKKIVFKLVTEGSTYGDVPSNIGEPGILRPALADAAERLATSPRYRAIIDPPKAAVTEAAKVAHIKIKRAPEFSGNLQANLDTIKKAVVTVTSNKGSGSGFVISEDGTVLTAEHVVSGSKLVKANTPGGKECYGEVVAVSKQRDLAVVRLDCGGFIPLPVSRQKIVEGGEVYAIGTPLSDKLQFTVTKGVVSGLRKIDQLEYIQSDVSVLPGNSGGPLLDARGNVVGVTDLGITTSEHVPLGVNFFIPLADMDKYVPVDFE